MKDMCIICRRPRGDHLISTLECPPHQTYYRACTHERRIGVGYVSGDGLTGWLESTCQDCGERIVFGKPPAGVHQGGPDERVAATGN